MGCSQSAQNEDRKSERAMKAAVLIQNWYRCYKARLELRRRQALNIFENIEYAEEQDQMQLANFFTFMLENYAKAKESSENLPQIFGNTMERKSEPETVIRMIEVPDNYYGPRLKFPLTFADVILLVDAFKEKQILHARYVLQVLLEVKKVLQQLPNIVRISSTTSKELTICGDIHGKLDDLFLIFYKNGLPSGNNRYIFNGDFVDRGQNSMEVLMVLFSFLLVYPNDVYLNRGNHEDYLMNMRYGFTKEIMQKYKQHGAKILHTLEEVYTWLPLGTIIDGKILVIHGGIADNTDLRMLEEIKRNRMRSVLMPPIAPSVNDFRRGRISRELPPPAIKAMEQLTKDEWDQIVNVLWSDPRSKKGCYPNTSRGGGCYFGPDVTENILSKFSLKMIIRSHECKPEGFDIGHDGKIITVFSASNYYEEGSNRGAYLKLSRDMTPRFFQYQSSQVSQGKTLHERVNIVENAAFRILGERLISRKSELMKAYQKYDPNNTGKISIRDWAKATGEIVELKLPWLSLCSRLVNLIENGQVFYTMGFKDLPVVKAPEEAKSGMVETLVRYRSDLKIIFNTIDQDHSGLISMDEFRAMWKLFCSHYNVDIDDTYVNQLAYSMDLNKDGSIDFNEFLTAFDVVHRLEGNK
ncbi:serine/threonine-protein phosphatase with EF-hands 1 [Dromiciops gliroides]|uniref:serine/threonine-protein phosphatase with EF-hands 1 n=1 Tax=Dromiciops gliroides TaxID=33562 RepID=UPI001CC3A944|nr:serine/threonine-protein phosphatase with EF-hands 1 [Dromiciops gliroides]XP_043852716.1 serine/threonine-protein phosphatase with EF-hands 1 [Dromiciops gliroides]